MDSNYEGPAALVDNDGHSAPLAVRLWAVNPAAAPSQTGDWGGEVERLDGLPLPRPIFSSGSEDFLLRLPNGAEGRFRISYENVPGSARAEVTGVGLAPF